jgi:hypothetical protein
MNKIIWIAIIVMVMLPGRAAGFESVTDAELDGTSGTAGLALKLYADRILNDPGLTPEEAEKLWREMTPEERQAARQKFRQALMEMPPEERAEIRRQMLDRYLSLPPEEQEMVRDQMRERVESMSADEKTEYMKFRDQMLQPPEPPPRDPAPGNGMFNGVPPGPMR